MPNNSRTKEVKSPWAELRQKTCERNSRYRRRTIDGTHEKTHSSDDNSATVLWINQEPGYFSLHWHSTLEIVMPLENTCSVSMNQTVQELQEGDILVIPPGELHELTPPSTGTRLILLVDLSLFRNFRGFTKLFSLLSRFCLITKTTMPEIYEKEHHLLMQIAGEYAKDDSLSDPSILALLIQFFTLLARNNQELPPAAPPLMQSNKQREYIEKFNIVFNYIEQHYMEDITLESTAAQIGFSKFHFSRLFHQFTDTSFYDYLCIRRIKAAENLLLDPNLPITEIALQSGFASISTFNRVFKKIKECTPTEFKEFYKETVRNGTKPQ